jgi:hypothetical protein
MSSDVETANAPEGIIERWIHRGGYKDQRDFLLRVVQPGLVGLIDGTISSVAPIFAAAITSSSHTAFVVGLGVALGAGVSMITGGMTVLGSIFHTLPFIISDVNKALVVAGAVIAVELFAIAWIRHRFLEIAMRASLVFIGVGLLISLAIGVGLGVS